MKEDKYMRYENTKEYYLVLKRNGNEAKLEVSLIEALLLVTELKDYVEVLCDDEGEVLYAGKDYVMPMTDDARMFAKNYKFNAMLEKYKAESAEDEHVEDEHDDESDDWFINEESTKAEWDPTRDEWNPAYLIKYRGITTMGWCNRTENCLKRANILFLGQLLQMTAEDIIRIRNLGKRSLREIRDTLHSMGLALKDEQLSFDEKVQICVARGNNLDLHCASCPLQEDSCNCFYNESHEARQAVEKASCTTNTTEDEFEAHYNPEDLEGAE